MLLFTPFPIPIPIPIPVPFFGGLPNTEDIVEEEEKEQMCGGRVVWRLDHTLLHSWIVRILLTSC